MVNSNDVSALGPIDPNSVANEAAYDGEKEKAAPWIVRKLAESMTGRIVISSYETLKATGTSVICLSPWGDSSPLLLPCIRFRDLVVHTVVAATGGVAAVAAPVVGSATEVIISTVGDSILVEIGVHTGFDLANKAAEDLISDKITDTIIPIHSKRLETTGVKVLQITLRYKHTVCDAALGFYRSSIHKDNSLFSTVKDYLAIEKGWFSPYLFASGRRPIIPRSMTPDIVFCHGPFLTGDYNIGERLLAESNLVINLSTLPPPPSAEDATKKEEHKTSLADIKHSVGDGIDTVRDRLSHFKMSDLTLPSLKNSFARSRTPSPEPQLAPVPTPPVPRRMVILLVGLKPHRGLWTLSQRPGESVMNYILLNGAPAIVVPVKPGSPLIAWDGLTLETMWKVELPPDGGVSTSGKFEGIVKVIAEFLDMCIDWERFLVRKDKEMVKAESPDEARTALSDAIALLVAAGVRSKDSKEVKKELSPDRAGIAMWRIP